MSIRFGTDGWRAIMGEAFTPANVARLAAAVAQALPPGHIIVGYDTRRGSPDFAATAAEALIAAGRDVVFSDTFVPTPALSYAVATRHAAAGLMVTASHNPPRYNGIKVKDHQGAAIGLAAVAAIESALDRGVARPASPRGTLKRTDLGEPYRRRLGELVDLAALREAGFTLVADPMYGAGTGWLPRLLAAGPTTVTELHPGPNPDFPGLHAPEPVAANLQALAEAVPATHAQAGLALDGDADRVGLVDEHGQYVDQQRAFSLLALYLLVDRGWRGTIVKSVNGSRMLDRLAGHHGLRCVTTPVGFTHLGPAFVAHDALIAGEESGGFAFRGHLPERDGLLAALYILDSCRRTGRGIRGLVDRLLERAGPHAYRRLDLALAPEERPLVATALATKVPAEIAGLPVHGVDRTDGLKLTFADEAWLLIRVSGTEPVARLYAEADDAAAVDRLLAGGQRLLAQRPA